MVGDDYYAFGLLHSDPIARSIPESLDLHVVGGCLLNSFVENVHVPRNAVKERDVESVTKSTNVTNLGGGGARTVQRTLCGCCGRWRRSS
jgi:hypothetical protein